MTIDELKNNMHLLNANLGSKHQPEINIGKSRCCTAQARLFKNYRRGAVNSLILSLVFLANWIGNAGDASFPAQFKCFLGVYLFIGAVWYGIVAFRVKHINLAGSTPYDVVKSVSSFRKMVIIGEIVMGIGLVVFFTLFLEHLITVAQYKFWLVLGALVVFTVIGVIVFLPKLLRDFRELNEITK